MAAPKHGSAPIVIEETAGTKAYCQCGWSATLPYCDGAHARQQTGCTPIVCDVAADGKKAVCPCHQSAVRPWCDGTHKRLAAPT
jgi:CDGSH-type Zn-finger protein